MLATEGEAEINAFSLRMGSAQIPKWLREMERDGLIERSYRARTTATRAKRRRAVRLVQPSGYAGFPPASRYAGDPTACGPMSKRSRRDACVPNAKRTRSAALSRFCAQTADKWQSTTCGKGAS